MLQTAYYRRTTLRQRKDICQSDRSQVVYRRDVKDTVDCPGPQQELWGWLEPAPQPQCAPG